MRSTTPHRHWPGVTALMHWTGETCSWSSVWMLFTPQGAPCFLQGDLTSLLIRMFDLISSLRNFKVPSQHAGSWSMNCVGVRGTASLYGGGGDGGGPRDGAK